MTFTQTLLDGNERAFRPSTLTPMQKLTLRFVIVGLVYYGFAAIEGMIMRLYQIEPFSLIPAKQYFGILTAHPLVGIFGSTYLLVFGAFLFLVPFLMKKPLWSFRLANWTLWLIAGGTMTFWLDGFISHYAPLYTLYWPLPADFDQFHPLSGAIFILGIALIMVGTALLRDQHLQDHHLHPGRGGAPAGPGPAGLGPGLHRPGQPLPPQGEPQGAPGLAAGGGHRPRLGGHRAQRPGHHCSPGC